MRDFSIQRYQAVLDQANSTSQSIQQITLFMLTHNQYLPQMAKYWHREITASNAKHKLILLYIANDVMQTGLRKYGSDIVEAFEPYLPEVFQSIFVTFDETVKRKARRVLKIWKERSIVDDLLMTNLEKICDNDPVTSMAPVNSFSGLPSYDTPPPRSSPSPRPRPIRSPDQQLRNPVFPPRPMGPMDPIRNQHGNQHGMGRDERPGPMQNPTPTFDEIDVPDNNSPPPSPEKVVNLDDMLPNLQIPEPTPDAVLEKEIFTDMPELQESSTYMAADSKVKKLKSSVAQAKLLSDKVTKLKNGLTSFSYACEMYNKKGSTQNDDTNEVDNHREMDVDNVPLQDASSSNRPDENVQQEAQEAGQTSPMETDQQEGTAESTASKETSATETGSSSPCGVAETASDDVEVIEIRCDDKQDQDACGDICWDALDSYVYEINVNSSHSLVEEYRGLLDTQAECRKLVMDELTSFMSAYSEKDIEQPVDLVATINVQLDTLQAFNKVVKEAEFEEIKEKEKRKIVEKQVESKLDNRMSQSDSKRPRLGFHPERQNLMPESERNLMRGGSPRRQDFNRSPPPRFDDRRGPGMNMPPPRQDGPGGGPNGFGRRSPPRNMDRPRSPHRDFHPNRSPRGGPPPHGGPPHGGPPHGGPPFGRNDGPRSPRNGPPRGMDGHRSPRNGPPGPGRFDRPPRDGPSPRRMDRPPSPRGGPPRGGPPRSPRGGPSPDFRGNPRGPPPGGNFRDPGFGGPRSPRGPPPGDFRGPPPQGRNFRGSPPRNGPPRSPGRGNSPPGNDFRRSPPPPGDRRGPDFRSPSPRDFGGPGPNNGRRSPPRGSPRDGDFRGRPGSPRRDGGPGRGPDFGRSPPRGGRGGGFRDDRGRGGPPGSPRGGGFRN